MTEKNQMNAAIYMGKEQVELRKLPIPELGENDVLIKNLYSSICGTDVAVYRHGPGTGHRITVGGEFGHETVSSVAAVGKNVTEFQVGDRVYPYPLFAKDDTSRAGTLGGFSEYILIPNARKAHSLYPVPDGIPDRLACLIEPFTVGCRAARRGILAGGRKAAGHAEGRERPDGGSVAAGWKRPDGGSVETGRERPDRGSVAAGQEKPETALVFGAGTIGMAAAVSLKYFGLERVMVCDVSDFRLDIARQLGFAVCNPSVEALPEKAAAYFGTARALTGRTADVDVWLDAAGSEGILDDFMAWGKIESRFVSVAVNNALRRLDLLHLTYAQKSIVGSGGYMPEDVRDVMNIMAGGAWDLERLITHEFSLDQIEQAIRTASDPGQALNVTIRFA